MLETSLANLNALLSNATDPDTIKALTDAIADANKTIEEIALKDALIKRQADDIKKLYLNDTPANHNKPEDPTGAPAKDHVPTLDEIISKIEKGNK